MTAIDCDEHQATSTYATWLRVMAVLYDPFLWLGEIVGMRRRRRALLARARGRVVEIEPVPGWTSPTTPTRWTNSF
ncbi:hypothetical protein BH09ACT8_BH09ACT8_03820 [soil metagenome]